VSRISNMLQLCNSHVYHPMGNNIASTAPLANNHDFAVCLLSGLITYVAI
jgi:hypothetical protein